MDIWHTAVPEREDVSIGWLGKYLDAACAGDDPRAGVALGNVLPLAMQGRRLTPLAFERPESFRYRGDRDRCMRLNSVPGKLNPRPGVQAGDQIAFLTKVAMDAQAGGDEVIAAVREYRTTSQYPTSPLARDLRNIAAMIASDLPTRVYYCQQGGYDTHVQQANRHSNLMRELSEALGAFWNDIKAQKLTDKVMVLTFSEFGRRVAQNASGGTDHGTAGVMMALGATLKAGVHGERSDFADLDSGDLRFGTDFRSVYATVLERWMQLDSTQILGRAFEQLSFI
jgi:uncharacterized protein (DUF1501 family)